MKLRVFLALLCARAARFALRLTHRGGTALPGRVAMRLCPDILRYLGRDVKTVLVTGTNGKTTSCQIVEQLFAEEGVSCFSNKGGANLIQGIATAFALRASLTGRIRESYAVMECDEATMPEACRQIQPVCILLTNIFSDQLDRFGDVGNTLSVIKKGVRSAPNAAVCLNADCSLSSSMAESLPNPVVFYGVETELYRQRVREVSDAPRCLRCGAEYSYTLRTYGHLGAFRCPRCGYGRHEAQVAVTGLLRQDAEGSRVLLRLDGEEYEAEIAVPGGYNVYNAAGAAAVAMALGFRPESAVRAMGNFRCGFGRMEKMELGSCSARMVLVKNPAGCNQALNFLANLEGEALFVIALNDRAGDGTDISWIYDADFEALLRLGERLRGVFCAGDRGADMAVRLRYARFPMEKLRVFTDYDALIDELSRQSAPVVIMPTYSAMMELRGKLAERYGLREFWE